VVWNVGVGRTKNIELEWEMSNGICPGRSTFIVHVNYRHVNSYSLHELYIGFDITAWAHTVVAIAVVTLKKL
jgi:hypothetical protein